MPRQRLPLDALLERDRERELQQALLTLPEKNRLVLLMHVWGGSSYEDIAGCTGVPVTTVEGRIYRAKRQLRRLLHQADPVFLDGPQRRFWQPQEGGTESRQQRTKTMASSKQSVRIADGQTQPPALALFTRRLSTMLDAGIPLVRVLDVLQEVPPPYGDIAPELKQKVEQGARLSQALSERPDLFATPYVVLIRAGEIGGILEETVQRMVQLMRKEWQLACRRPQNEEPLLLLHPAAIPLPERWAVMSGYQRTVTLILFFETFALLLQSGVPIVQAMEVVAALLPSAQREGWMTVRKEVLAAQPLSPGMERMGIFPRFALEMITLGLESGNLDFLLHRLAEAFEDDIAYETPT
jgi:hypothetical protein